METMPYRAHLEGCGGLRSERDGVAGLLCNEWQARREIMASAPACTEDDPSCELKLTPTRPMSRP